MSFSINKTYGFWEGGGGHYNECSNEYITEKFLQLGYDRKYEFEEPLR